MRHPQEIVLIDDKGQPNEEYKQLLDSIPNLLVPRGDDVGIGKLDVLDAQLERQQREAEAPNA